MVIWVLAFLIGFTVGLRSFTAPAAISVAARWGGLNLTNTWFAFLGYAWTPWLLTGAAIGELINDKLPNTPSRKTLPQFAFRIVSGAISGASIGATSGVPRSVACSPGYWARSLEPWRRVGAGKTCKSLWRA